MAEKIRLGLVGVGKIAHDQHIPALLRSDAIDLVATADPVESIAGVPAYRSMADMLAAEQLDAVSFCTPPGIRSALAAQALAAGLDVMVEKPPAAALSQAEALRSIAAARGRTLFAAWHSRESACVDAVAAWLVGKEVREVAVDWREDVRHWHPGQDWLLATGGFGIFDPAINAVSILTKILPSVLAFESSHLSVPENRETPLQADVLLRHGAAPVRLGLDFLQEGPQQWDIRITTDAGVVMMRSGGHFWHLDGVEQPSEPEQEYRRLYARFARLVAARESDFDVSPLMLVSDALLLGQREVIAPFYW